MTSMRFSRALKDAPTTTSHRIHRSARAISSVALPRTAEFCKRLTWHPSSLHPTAFRHAGDARRTQAPGPTRRRPRPGLAQRGDPRGAGLARSVSRTGRHRGSIRRDLGELRRGPPLVFLAQEPRLGTGLLIPSGTFRFRLYMPESKTKIVTFDTALEWTMTYVEGVERGP